MARLRANLTYANVMATVAVFLALGGGAYAAIQLPRNSVKAKQIATGAVRSGEVKNRSLRRADFRLGSLLVGPQGALRGRRERRGSRGRPASLVRPTSRVVSGQSVRSSRTATGAGP
jgi:hypothetical protein